MTLFGGRAGTYATFVLLAIGLDRVYRATILGLVKEWQSSPEASYGLVLAAAAIAVAWRRRRLFMNESTPQDPGLPGLALAICGVLLYLVGFLGADVFLTRVSIVFVLAGSIWTLAGWRSFRIMAAPLVFLLIAVPLPALIINEITLPLQFVASGLAESMLSAASVPVYRDGNLLLLPSATLEVAEACSGLRSAVSLGAVGIVLAWATEPNTIRRAAIVAATVPVAVFMNGLRIASTGVATEIWGHPPTGDWHTFMGWVTFVISVGVLAGLQRIVESRGGLIRVKADPTRDVNRTARDVAGEAA